MRCSTIVINEAGYREALLGVSLSYGKPKGRSENWEDFIDRMAPVAERLTPKDKGHNKFLESMQVWIDIDMPRYWWSEFDTYRVGTSKQSESTMHTLFKRELTQKDFVEDLDIMTLENLNCYILRYNREGADKDILFRKIKQALPEGFLQRRIVNTNYKVLRNIIAQRKNHRLHEWKFFIDSLYDDCIYTELL